MQQDWISIHIFYHGDQNHLIVNCIAPLVEELREQGLIKRYFFIKYWVEGPHVRLRFLPTSDADVEKIKWNTERAITAFLQKRPALYSLSYDIFAPIYKNMFVGEYGEARWQEVYGDEGIMPLRQNNTFDYIEYEPEYSRYGGVEGVELAEWHFEHSSDTVINLLREVNVNVQSILLGRSIQLALPFFYGVFETDERVLFALDQYIATWMGRDPQQSHRIRQYEKKYQRMSAILTQRIRKIREYMLNKHSSARRTETEENWKKHIIEFRLRLQKLYTANKLIADFESPQASSFTLDDVYHYLQSSYVHMTNNRLGVSIPQEVYIGYLLKRALVDILTEERQKIA
ncbi:MAG TPA: thiopeptide-type bacteriocin biosynthesis protein [Ktedonobacteraceae bacterium]|nr:thiopeptide-type bacteriocin biosynthesis protein [Ktedonobacteraceae bacterium]